MTGSVEDDGLGFDYKWNMGWMNDFIGYMCNDPLFRGSHHNELTFSMIYAYSENFLLSLSHDEVVHGKGSLLNKMPGERDKKFANLRLALGFLVTHPGKKLLFMGQEFGQEHEWAENKALDWEDLEQPEHQKLRDFMKALIAIYRQYPALYKLDYDYQGFEWINCVDWEKSLVSFMRRTSKPEETLVVICNFSDVAYDAHQVGVPYAGKYKEILNSDAEAFGGSGVVNPRVKIAKKVECDDRPYSLTVKVPALGISIYSFTKTVEKVVDNKTARSRKKSSATKKSGLKEEIRRKMELAEEAGTKKADGKAKTETKSKLTAKEDHPKEEIKSVKESKKETSGTDIAGKGESAEKKG